MGARIADEENRNECPEPGDDHGAGPDESSRRIGGRERAGRKRRCRDTEIAGRLVQPERETASHRTDKVDLHHDRHRPGQTLVETEEDVGGDDYPPTGSKRDQDRNWQRNEPPKNEETFSPGPLGKTPGSEVRHRLRDAEGNDEREDGALRGQPEVVLADERKDAALEAHHRPDEGVERDEESELTRVRAKSEANRSRAHACVGESPRLLAATIAVWSAGGGGESAKSPR